MLSFTGLETARADWFVVAVFLLVVGRRWWGVEVLLLLF